MADILKQELITVSFVFDTSILTGATDKKQVQIPNSYGLQVLGIFGALAVFSAANSNNNVAAYDQIDAGNTATPAIPGRHLARVRFEGSQTGPWHDNTNGVKYSNLVSSANKPLYLPIPYVITPGESVTCQLWNDSGSTIRDQIDLLCRKIPGR
jgi:hypothetical protein